MSITIFGASDQALRTAQNLMQNKQFEEALKILDKDWNKSQNVHTGLFIAKALHALGDSKTALVKLKNLNIDANLSNLNQAFIHYDHKNYSETYALIEQINKNNYHKEPFLNWVRQLVINPQPSEKAYIDAINLRFTSLDIQARAILTLEEFMPTPFMQRANEENSLPPQFNPLFFKKTRLLKKMAHQKKLLQNAHKAIEEHQLDTAIHLYETLSALTMQPKENEALLKKIALTKLEQNQEPLAQEEKLFFYLICEKYKEITTYYLANANLAYNQMEIELIAFAFFSQNDFRQTIKMLTSLELDKLSAIANLYLGLAHYHAKQPAHAIESIKPFILKEPAAYTTTIFTFFSTLYPNTTFTFEYN